MKRKILTARPLVNGQYLGVKLQTQPADGAPGEIVMQLITAEGKLHREFKGATAVTDYRDEQIKLQREIEDGARSEVDQLLKEMNISPNPGQEQQAAEAAKKKKDATG